ncbi:hypothetical protein Tco_0367918 [Tanacetum coccineum]
MHILRAPSSFSTNNIGAPQDLTIGNPPGIRFTKEFLSEIGVLVLGSGWQAWRERESALYNAIMEAGGKDNPLILAHGNYVEWKSRIERYIDTKPNHELIPYCLENPPYEYKWIPNTTPKTPATRGDLYQVGTHIQKESRRAMQLLKQGKSINVQDLESSLFWDFGKFTSWEGETLDSYYSRFYKMMNELVRNQCIVTNYQLNVQFLLQLKPEWQRSQVASRNKGNEIANYPPPTYDSEPEAVTDDEASSKEKEIDKLMA